MPCMNVKKVPTSFRCDEDVLEVMDKWCDSTHVGKGDAAQLGMWMVMHLTPDQRDELFRAMDQREPVSLAVMSGQDDDQLQRIVDRQTQALRELWTQRKEESG